MPKHDEDLLIPDDRGEQLLGYVNTVFYNVRAFFTQQKSHSRVFNEVGEIFHDGREYLAEVDEGSRPVFFMIAAESAFLSAAVLSAGMVTLEQWKPLRGCLESAAYGFYINARPERFKAWVDSSRDEQADRKIGFEFSFKTICRDFLAPADAKIATQVTELYEEAIRRGAHFNQLGFRANLSKLNIATRRGKFSVVGGDPSQILYSWRRALETGHAALRIFDLIFAEKWAAKGLSARIYKLRDSIRKLPKGVAFD